MKREADGSIWMNVDYQGLKRLYGSMKMKYVTLLIQLVTILGPKFKEILPILLQIIELVKGIVPPTPGTPTGISFSMPSAPSVEYQQFINDAKNAGADESDAHQLAQLM